MVGALCHPSDIQHVPLIKNDRHANHLEVNRSVTSINFNCYFYRLEVASQHK